MNQPPDRIPFNRPTLEGNELAYVQHAVERGHTAAGGPFARDAAELLRESLDVTDVLLTTSCTDALEMSALLLGLSPDDTVVVPSFTFVSTALAFAREGAQIRFCDIESETLGLDPAHLSELMDGSVRAVVPVHYAGVGCDIAGIRKAMAPHPGAELVEDNAHGLFGRYQGAPLGSLGRFATLSFHETKNFICGEGGALVLTDPDDVDRAHVLYDKGTNRRAFAQGKVDKYSWQDTGSSFGMSDVLAAYLLGQLEQRDEILRKRRGVFERYYAGLEPYADELDIRLPFVPDDRAQAYHMFYVLLPDRETRDGVLTSLEQRGVQATFHYVPLHTSDAGRRLAAPVECPVSEEISGRLLRLPFHNRLTSAQIDYIVESLVSILRGVT